MVRRAMPRAFQGRSRAVTQPCPASGLFRVRYFSCLCSFAYHFGAEIRIIEPFPLFSQCFFWWHSDQGTDTVLVHTIPFQFHFFLFPILALETLKYRHFLQNPPVK